MITGIYIFTYCRAERAIGDILDKLQPQKQPG